MGKWDEMQVEFSWVHSRRQQDTQQHSCGMLLFTTDYPDYVRVSCFSCMTALLNIASPWLGLCLSAKRPFDSHAHAKATSTASVSPLTRQPCFTLLTSFMLGPCLLSTKDFDMALLMSRFLLNLFSYWSPTSPPFLFLKCSQCRLVFSPSSYFWIAQHPTEKVQKHINSNTPIFIRYQKECLRMLDRLQPCSSSNIVFAISAGEMTRSYALCIANICCLRCFKFNVSLLFSQAPKDTLIHCREQQ
jgi:hypothetical protein